MDAIYARQSLDKKDSLSIEGQIEKCRLHTQSEVKIYQDKGFSGKNTCRPAFTALMEAVEAGQISKILVYRIDRFSRSISDFYRVWEKLQQHNVAFQSVTESFDTSTPMGLAMLSIILIFAQLERETTAERVRDNYHHRFSLGAWPGGPAPFGFDLTKVYDKDGRRVSSLVANEQAEIVQFIFDEYTKPDTSLRSIAHLLTEMGTHGPKQESWDNVTLSRLLHSPLYVKASEDIYWHFLAKGLRIQQDISAFDGIHACNVVGRRDRSRNKYNDLPGQMLSVSNHEGLISTDVWLQAQEKLEKNRQIPRDNAGKYSWLTGLMKCGNCGYAVKINYIKAEDKFYLICSGRSNRRICHTSIHIDLRELEDYIAAQIEEQLQLCPSEEVYPDSSEEADAVQNIERKIERLVGALAESNDVTVSYINREIERLHKEREVLLTRLQHTKTTPRHLDFARASFDEKKIIASELIDRILLDGENANIIWKI
jgi:DNA invertase Pin-like site-specific DNA recombinase